MKCKKINFSSSTKNPKDNNEERVLGEKQQVPERSREWRGEEKKGEKKSEKKRIEHVRK